jgi:hypothetical protein
MATPVAKFLVEFGKNDHPPSFKAQDELVLPEEFETGENTAEQQLEAAFARGLEQGRENARADYEADMAVAQAKFAEEIEARRESWVLEQGERLRQQITASFQEFQNSIAASVTRVLVPFLTDVVVKQTVDDLLKALATMTGQTPIGTIKISGPEDLIQALQERVAGGNFNLEFISSELNEVTIVANQTMVVTQLQAWIDRFNDSIR